MNEGYFGLDLKTGSLEELPLTKGWIQAADWSPDGDALAYLTGGYEDEGTQLAVFRPEDGTKKVLRTFVPGPGSCGSADGEVSVSWAPDGHALIVVITHLENQDETMFVLDPAGKDIIEPRSGTNARWAPNSKRIYYREMGGDRKWFALNSETGDRGTLGAMKPGTYNLAVSPDGGLLAYADGEEHSGVYVYDVATKIQRKVAEDAVMPVWVGPQTILVSDTKSCGDGCSMSLWEPSGTISTVDVISEIRKLVAAEVMWDANVLLEELSDPAPATTPTASPSVGPTPQETGEPTPSPTPSTEPSPSPSTDPTTEPSPIPTAD
jgi:dipeptidyl aminopeptidase/acylaminoacyl peptidase